MDMVSHEQRVGMTPPYDQPSAIRTPMPRLTESCYKVPDTGSWWYDGQDRPVSTGLNVDRYIADAGNSILSLMDFTAMVDGRFPPQQEKFLDLMKDYLPPVWQSLHGVCGGGFMYGGMRPGSWNDGAYGYVTVSRARPGTAQYVHVTTRPTTGDRVRIRDNGYRVDRITDLRTGRRLHFDQRDGTLTIRGIADWDPYDTVFEVRTEPRREGVYPVGAVKASEPALTDGDFTTYTDNKGVLPAGYTLDLGRVRRAAFIGINQREWSPTYNRETFGRKEGLRADQGLHGVRERRRDDLEPGAGRGAGKRAGHPLHRPARRPPYPLPPARRPHHLGRTHRARVLPAAADRRDTGRIRPSHEPRLTHRSCRVTARGGAAQIRQVQCGDQQNLRVRPRTC